MFVIQSYSDDWLEDIFLQPKEIFAKYVFLHGNLNAALVIFFNLLNIIFYRLWTTLIQSTVQGFGQVHSEKVYIVDFQN